jgi:hypothetical protein
MRHRWTVSLLVLASAAGAYAAQGKPTEKPEGLPFKVGDALTLRYSPGQDRECRVEEIRGTFVRCDHARAIEMWLNISQATAIELSARR